MNHIKKNIKNEYSAFEKELEIILSSNVKLIDYALKYVTLRKGKRLRPILALLCAKLIGLPNKKTFLAASIIEVLHIATLVHDDVVDNSDLRRGWPSLKKIYKNKTSILIGDFMFTKALISMVNLKCSKSLALLSETSRILSEGEIMQIEKNMKNSMDEDSYYDMIEKKTGSLFSASCSLGAISVGAEEKNIAALSKFGLLLGKAFQIKDDLFDLDNYNNIGKPSGYDVKKNLITLPLIFAYQQMNKVEKIFHQNRIKTLISKKKKIKYSMKLVNKYNGLDYAKAKLNDFTNEAKNLLNMFDDSLVKESLIDIINFNIYRKV